MTLRSRRLLMPFLLLFALAACAPASEAAPAPAPLATPQVWPTEGWPTASLTARGFEPGLPEAIERAVSEHLPFLDALLFIRHGDLVYENYYNGHDADSLHDVASVTKSWTSALVGAARAEGHLANLDAALPELIPQYFETDQYADKREITLRHLLTMRSGIDFSEDDLNSGLYGGAELLDGDLNALGLGFPVAWPPGETWNYSTLDSQLVSAIVQQALGRTLADYAGSGLFAELGIETFDWWVDGTGTTIGGQNLSLRARDAAKLGLLYLHRGQWDGKQVIPAEWVQESLTPQGEAFHPPTNQNEVIEWYGYHWWTWKGDWFYGYRSFQAAGYGGQQVLVFPELDLIIVTLANLEGVDPETATAQATALNEELILPLLVPALLEVEVDAEH